MPVNRIAFSDTNQSILLLEKNPLLTIVMSVPLEVEMLPGGVRPASVVATHGLR